MHALLIAASPAERSRSSALLDAAGAALERAGVDTHRLALRELPAEALLRARRADPKLGHALAQVAQAGVVVLATPIYKAAYSGLLKAFLDLLPQDGLQGKWTWSLATGGSAAHTLALDHSLRPVLDNLGAHQGAPSVYALESQIGLPGAALEAGIAARLDAGALRLVQAWAAPRQAREWNRLALGGVDAIPADLDLARCL